MIYDGGRSEVAMGSVRRMIGLQRHRGPDGEDFYDGVGASLGHCRLAIIDLSDAGKQPMSDPQGRYWITFNQQDTDYRELAEELHCAGHRFRGKSDTEVLLAAYCEWGDFCLERLRRNVCIRHMGRNGSAVVRGTGPTRDKTVSLLGRWNKTACFCFGTQGAGRFFAGTPC